MRLNRVPWMRVVFFFGIKEERTLHNLCAYVWSRTDKSWACILHAACYTAFCGPAQILLPFPTHCTRKDWHICRLCATIYLFPLITEFSLKFNSMQRYLSSGLIVVQVHERLCLFWPLSALPPVSGIHKCPWKSDAKVHVVWTAGPLQKKRVTQKN